MPTYIVKVSATTCPIDNEYEVEADSAEEARQIALDEAKEDSDSWMPELEAKDAIRQRTKKKR